MAVLAIEAKGLEKRYGDLTAVAGIDIGVSNGSVYALLGPNGAGKTTTIGMLTTLLSPSAGAASVAGFDIIRQAHEVRARIGVTFQDLILDQDLTGRQILDIHGQLYAQPKKVRLRRIQELVDLVQLGDAIDRTVRGYSGGMKRRLELARGLLTEPQILFLDEPTQGLDPQNRAGIWAYLRELNQKHGLTVLLTTHYMEEAEALADRVGIMDHGTLIVEGDPAELVAGMGADVVRLRGQGAFEPFEAALVKLAAVTRVEQDITQSTLQVYVDNGSRHLVEILHLAEQYAFQVDDVSISRPSLGDVFLKLTGSAFRD